LKAKNYPVPACPDRPILKHRPVSRGQFVPVSLWRSSRTVSNSGRCLMGAVFGRPWRRVLTIEVNRLSMHSEKVSRPSRFSKRPKGVLVLLAGGLLRCFTGINRRRRNGLCNPSPPESARHYPQIFCNWPRQPRLARTPLAGGGAVVYAAAGFWRPTVSAQSRLGGVVAVCSGGLYLPLEVWESPNRSRGRVSRFWPIKLLRCRLPRMGADLAQAGRRGLSEH